MILGLCSIQRDRGPWITEWLAFHYVVGFRKFYIYAHSCKDNTVEILNKLSNTLDIRVLCIEEKIDKVQLKAYLHAYNNFGNDVDWMAFLDGDEFLFPTAENDLTLTLSKYDKEAISGLAAYWVCFGSNGHIKDPAGLVIENYTRRPPLTFNLNSHVKSIIRGKQKAWPGPNSHVFNTQFGTYDEQMRHVDHGHMQELIPSYNELRINHYVCQSYEYFMNFKKKSGMADASHAAERPDDWWSRHDLNDEYDTEILKFRDSVKQVVAQLDRILAG